MDHVQTQFSRLTARPGGALRGRVTAPGDKSLSHRAILFGALAIRETEIEGLLEGEDVKATIGAMRSLGAEIVRIGAGAWRVRGLGVGGLETPDKVVDFGNAGTAARLILGAVATHPITMICTGDASLCRRPMGRVLEPLTQMGAHWAGPRGPYLPLTLHGAKTPIPITYRLPVPSAQVKSAVLLAGLNAPGRTTVIEPEATRDHTERLLALFGARIEKSNTGSGERAITVTGHAELVGQRLVVPGDPSSAAFLAVAALVAPGSDVVIENVLVNPLRAGLYETLREMGAAIEFSNRREACGEPVADLRVEASTLSGVDVPAERAPSMIDEYPVLAVAAAFAKGRTRMNGLAELRVKESDRLSAIARGLAACGVGASEGEDFLVVEGEGGPPRGNATVDTHMDHRIAMAFLTLGLGARAAVTVNQADMIATSFPGYRQIMAELGADIGDAP